MNDVNVPIINLSQGIEATRSQIRNLREILESPGSISPPNGLVSTLRDIEESLAPANSERKAAIPLVHHALKLTEALSACPPREISRPAYLAASRLAVALLVLSRLEATDEKSGRSTLFCEALHEALCEIAAQCLILELARKNSLSAAVKRSAREHLAA